MRIAWTPSLSVGIEEIDRRQRGLYEAANGLVAAAGAGNGELEARVRRLLDHARSQFEAEERWLVDAKDPAIVRHAHEHRRFLEDLEGIAAQLARGQREAVDALDVRTFVPAWIGAHVSRSDRDLVRARRAANGRNGANGDPSKR